MPNYAALFTLQPVWMEDVLNEGQKKKLKPNADMSLELKLDHTKCYCLMSQILPSHGCSLVENGKLISRL